MATNDDNISIRTRIRKASTSINPEFGPSIESLLTFVSSSSSSTQSSWKKKQPDPSIVITPLSILSGSSHSAVSAGGGNGGGGAAWRSASPLRSQSAPRGRPLSSSHRNRSFNNNSGHPPLLVRGGPSSHSATSLSSSVGRRSGSVTAATASSSGGGGNGNSGGVTTAEEGGTNRLELDLSNEHKLEVEEEEVEDGMVNISLEEENNNKSNHHHHTTTTTNDHGILKGSGGVIMMELETELRSNSSKDDDETREDKEVHQLLLLPPIQQQSQQQQRQQRTPSPLPIVRSGSGLSMPSMGVGGGGQQHDQQHNRSSNNSIVSSTGSSNSRPRSRSINARSRSINKNMRARSRSRGHGGGGDSLNSSGRGGGAGAGALSRGGAISLSGRRMRSAGAANAFNTSTVVCDDNDSMTDHSLYPNQEEEMMMMMETMNVLLKDIISVKHETPFSSSKKSDAELHAPVAMVGRAASFTPPPPTTTMLAAPQPLYRPGSKLSTTSQPLSPSVHSGLNCYRIYIHTRTNGYLEFNFDNNSNSYEVVLAYLRCHLKDGMVPPDDDDVPVVVVGNDGVGSSNAASKGPSSLEQPVNLTRTKSLSSKVTSKDNGGGGDDATVTSTSTTSTGDKQQQHLPSSAFQPFISQSNSSNPIERLQTKAINRQLEQEHTPMNSIKESVAGWVSSIIDCANFGCCQDTTVTPEDKSVYNGNGIEGTPLRQQPQLQQQRVQSMTPTSKVLKSNGIGGLSFEVETVSSNMS